MVTVCKLSCGNSFGTFYSTLCLSVSFRIGFSDRIINLVMAVDRGGGGRDSRGLWPTSDAQWRHLTAFCSVRQQTGDLIESLRQPLCKICVITCLLTGSRRNNDTTRVETRLAECVRRPNVWAERVNRRSLGWADLSRSIISSTYMERHCLKVVSIVFS